MLLDTRLLGNNNTSVELDPQIIISDIPTNNRTSISSNLGIHSNSISTNTDSKFCNACKRSRATNLFTGRIQGKTYKSCSDCRLRDYNQRHTQAAQAATNFDTNNGK